MYHTLNVLDEMPDVVGSTSGSTDDADANAGGAGGNAANGGADAGPSALEQSKLILKVIVLSNIYLCSYM